MLIFLLNCISEINIFSLILFNPTYLLGKKKVNIYINFLVYFLLKYVCKINVFASILLNLTYLLNYCVRKFNVSLIT